VLGTAGKYRFKPIGNTHFKLIDRLKIGRFPNPTINKNQTIPKIKTNNKIQIDRGGINK
jgi:hypothetical protein